MLDSMGLEDLLAFSCHSACAQLTWSAQIGKKGERFAKTFGMKYNRNKLKCNWKLESAVI